MRADHTQAELSQGNHVRELLEPEPYASFGRGEQDCLRGSEAHPRSIPLPRAHLPSPWLRMQKYKMQGASHHCKGHHLLISVTVSWTLHDMVVGRTRAWAGKWVAGNTAGQLGVAQPLKTMLCPSRPAKATGPGSPALPVTQSKAGRLLVSRKVQSISSGRCLWACFNRINFRSHSPFFSWKFQVIFGM